MPSQWFGGQQGDHLSDKTLDVLDCLHRWPQDDDPRIVPRRKHSNVGEIEVQRQQRTAFRSADLGHPHIRLSALAFSATALVARLPISMMTLGIVLLVSTLSGSYGLAGQVSAAYIIGNALFAIPHGGLADRSGQGKVLWVDSVAFALTTGLMIVSIVQDWPLPWPHILAALAGAAIPQIGTMVRARWNHLLPTASERHTAFAAESVADEVVFVTGRAIVTLLATSFAPQAGLLAALAVGTIGAAALAAQRRTEPQAHPRDTMTARDRMPWGMLMPLTASAVALGSLFGALEVATVAYADDAGHKGYAGLMLGAFSLGSLAAGVVAGTVAWRRAPLPRVRIGMGLLGVNHDDDLMSR